MFIHPYSINPNFRLQTFLLIAGCTSLKPVFEYLHGLIQANQTFDRHDIHGKNTHKTLLYRLPKSERERRLNTYYKFMILRDPLERMMSGYKDKVRRLSVWEQGHMYACTRCVVEG